jgi:hypothetical protein
LGIDELFINFIDRWKSLVFFDLTVCWKRERRNNISPLIKVDTISPKSNYQKETENNTLTILTSELDLTLYSNDDKLEDLKDALQAQLSSFHIAKYVERTNSIP